MATKLSSQQTNKFRIKWLDSAGNILNKRNSEESTVVCGIYSKIILEKSELSIQFNVISKELFSSALIVNFEPCSSVSIVNFEHLIAGWVICHLTEPPSCHWSLSILPEKCGHLFFFMFSGDIQRVQWHKIVQNSSVIGQKGEP